MSARLQHALTSTSGWYNPFSASVHDKLHTWIQILSGFASQTTNLQELLLHLPTRSGATYASGTGMGGIFRDPTGQWFVWKSAFPLTTQAQLVCFGNPKGYISITDLGLCAYLS